jgi:hypothetical protein
MTTSEAWATLTEGLALALPRFATDDFLVLAAGDDRYVQCIQEPSDMLAQAAGGTPERPLSEEDRGRLRELGWQDPAGTGEQWHYAEVPWPMSHQAARELAERMIRTLREVYGAATPGDLTYRAVNAETGEPWDVSVVFAGLTRRPG